MSTNSERIAANNTRLSALVETANALPEAGSGEMQVEIVYSGVGSISVTYATSEGAKTASMSRGESTTITCLAGQQIAVGKQEASTSLSTEVDGAELLWYASSMMVSVGEENVIVAIGFVPTGNTVTVY